MVNTLKAQTFTDEEIVGMKEAFDAIDSDHSGELDLSEVVNFLAEVEIPEDLAPLIYFLFDGTETKGINFEDFKQFFVLLGKIAEEPLLIFEELFNKIDTDKSGEIDKKELHHFMNILGLDLQESEVDELFDAMDTDGSGTLSFPEVAQILQLS